jgi:hypothetical protein
MTPDERRRVKVFQRRGGKDPGHAVVPDSANQSRLNTVGGPLHLVVMFKGHVSNGGGVPSSFGYTFGLIGSLRF